jgi:hypothetical protein
MKIKHKRKEIGKGERKKEPVKEEQEERNPNFPFSSGFSDLLLSFLASCCFSSLSANTLIPLMTSVVVSCTRVQALWVAVRSTTP